MRAEVGTLSGGQRQSVAIARALLGEPRVVILDEPTAALGVAQTAQVLDLVKRLRERGLGVVLVSHNLADVFAVADRIVVLRLGRHAGDFDAAKVTQDDGRGRDHRRGRSRCATRGAERCPHGCRRRPGSAGSKTRANRASSGASSEGDLGSLRVIITLAVIWAIFQIAARPLPHARST